MAMTSLSLKPVILPGVVLNAILMLRIIGSGLFKW